MTSINITIEAMTRRDTLSGVFGAYVYAAFLVAGPWIFTVLGLLSLSAAKCDGFCIDLTVFRSVVIYNSMYALIVTSPLAFISGRYASEQVYQGKRRRVFYALVVSLDVFGVLSLAVVAPFYLCATTLDTPSKPSRPFDNAMMIGCSWLLIPFLGAMRAYNSVLLAFGVGAVSMLVFGSFLHDPPATSFLLAFNCSFAITNLILLATVVRRFGARIVVDPELLRRVGQEVGIAGGRRGLRARIMDRQDHHVARRSKRGPAWSPARCEPCRAMTPRCSGRNCLPYRSSRCSSSMWRRRFSSLIRGYHAKMQQRASLRELNEIVRNIGSHVLSSMFGLFAGLFIVAAMMIVLSFVFMTQLGLLPSYMGIFRVSLCSMAFYTSAMFCFSFLLYLDLRRPALLIVITFLVLNGVIDGCPVAVWPRSLWIRQHDCRNGKPAGRIYSGFEGTFLAPLSRFHHQ